MNTPHPFRFGVTLLRAASRQEWIEKCHQVEDLGYTVLQVPDHLGNQFFPTLARANNRHKWGETMFKKLFAALGLSCIIIILLAACGSSSNGPHPVHMSGNHFLQSSITIKKGESITLINDDPFGSHVIANGTWVNNTARPVREAGAPSVNNVNIGGNSSATIGPFTTAGTFQLYCTVHVGMNLTVVVQ